MNYGKAVGGDETMKTIKNGLIMAALGYSLSGCGAPLMQYIESSQFPEEKAVLEDLSVDGEFDSAEVTLSRSGYFIKCDNTHYFDFDHRSFAGEVENTGELHWGDVVYYDDNSDGRVDRLYTDGNIADVNNSRVNERYRELLNGLKKPYVHEVWDLRWK